MNIVNFALSFAIGITFGVAFELLALSHWRRRALAAEDAFRRLSALVKSGILVGAMIRGERPKVERAPVGMTLDEAQAEIDRIYNSLRPVAPTDGNVH